MKKTLLLLFIASVGIGVTGYKVWNTSSQETFVPSVTTSDTAETSTTEPVNMVVHGVIAAKTKTELVGESDVIIRGNVKNVLPSKWSNPNNEGGQDVRNIIQTDILIHINHVFKGTPYDKEITVRIDKGKVGNTTWVSEGYPDFTSGEDVLLFLRKDDSDIAKPEEQYYVLTGMLQGKFALDPKHPEDHHFKNNKDTIDLSSFAEDLPKAEDEYKKLPKPATAKKNI